jgi:uncharacterized membrane protein YgcG
VSNDEPEYLKALKRAQEQKKAAAAKPPAPTLKKGGPPSPAEREAIRWAREVGGKDVNIAASLSGARCVIVLHPITPFGAPRVSLEGVADREALAERIRSAIGAGENVMGAYELTTGRPLTHTIVEGKITFTPGAPRAVLKATTPERMLSQATRQAELLAKTRKADDFTRGPGGRGGPGGGAPGGRGGQGGRGGGGGSGGRPPR